MSEEPKTNRIPSRPLIALLAILASLALVAAACADDTASGGDSESEDSNEESSGESEGESASSPGAPEVPEECEGADDDAAATESAEERGEPDPSVAEGVEIGSPVVIAEGDGDEVIPGGTITAQYSIINPANGEVLQSTWGAGGPQPIPLDQAPESFTDGVAGMMVGGRSAFAITIADLGGAPPESGLSEDDPVVFVIDLVAVSEETSETQAGPEPDPDALAAAEERGAPEMSVPEGTTDTEQLVVIDDVVGEGPVVCPGDDVVAHYTGIQASDGEQFDSSWERGEPIPFGLDGVIQGWTEGLVGMQVGGRRTLVIPADLAYGNDEESGRPTGTLVFTIDLVAVG